jgi:tetratricopeptide (TPR) repeat protein
MNEAISHYEQALKFKPGHAEAHGNLGSALAALGRIEEAIAHYERALALKPDYAEGHSNLGAVLSAQGRTEEAAAHYERSAAIQPGLPEAHNNLGIVRMRQGRFGEALTHFERAIAINPHFAEPHNNLGNILKEEGRFQEAWTHYGRAIEIRPDYAEAHYNRSEIPNFRQGDEPLQALEKLAERKDLPPHKAWHVHFALAKALEDSGDYQRAFENLRRGNALKRQYIHYDETVEFRFVRRISALFDSGVFDRLQGNGDASPVPIFVLGMPRSGSTLIEQILASHPRIQAAGELVNLETVTAAATDAEGRLVPYPDYVPALDAGALRRIGVSYIASLPTLAEGKVRIVDKLPGNFSRIGLIRLILPNARIIHTTRNPIDTCVSCYSKLFDRGHHYTYDLAELGRYYRAYRDLMTHWRSVLPPDAMLDVAYEDVVADLEGQARRLIAYCGLPWDDRCLSFHTTNRAVRTASAVQVRRPLFRTSVQRWRRYKSSLGPLLHQLGDITSGDRNE